MRLKIGKKDFVFILKEDGTIDVHIPKDTDAGITEGQIGEITKRFKEGCREVTFHAIRKND